MCLIVCVCSSRVLIRNGRVQMVSVRSRRPRVRPSKLYWSESDAAGSGEVLTTTTGSRKHTHTDTHTPLCLCPLAASAPLGFLLFCFSSWPFLFYFRGGAWFSPLVYPASAIGWWTCHSCLWTNGNACLTPLNTDFRVQTTACRLCERVYDDDDVYINFSDCCDCN